MKKGCSIAAVLGFVSLILIGTFVPAMIWDGAVMKSIDVTVIGQDSGAPLPGRTVVMLGAGGVRSLSGLDVSTRSELISRLKEGGSAGTTDEHGRVTVRAHLRAGGTDTFFLHRGRFAADGRLLIVEGGDIVQEQDLEALYPGTHSIGDRLPPTTMKIRSKTP